MIITTSSWKGGTGKTTLNAFIAETLARRGNKVLIIDLDSNCAASQIYRQVLRDITSRHFLSTTENTFKGIYRAKEGIDIIPSDLNNMLLNNIMDTQLKINIKRTGLEEKYDYIIIDPPGHWCSHTRNAVFASNVLVIPGTCSDIDFEATRLYFKTLQECFIEANTYICVNAFDKEKNLPGIYEKYQKNFTDYLIPIPIPYIKSLKRITSDINYKLIPSVQKRLDVFIDTIISEEK